VTGYRPENGIAIIRREAWSHKDLKRSQVIMIAWAAPSALGSLWARPCDRLCRPCCNSKFAIAGLPPPSWFSACRKGSCSSSAGSFGTYAEILSEPLGWARVVRYTYWMAQVIAVGASP